MRKCIKVNDRSFWVDPETDTGQNYIHNGINNEPHIRRELQRLLPTANTFLDIGANCGMHTISAKQINPTLWVGAFEGSPTNVELLCMNVQGLPEVQIYPVVLADRPRMTRANGCWWNTTFRTDVDNPEYANHRLTAALPLDHFKLPKIDVIKIDVEGFEWLVLRGGAAMLSRDRPTIIFEFFPNAIRDAGDSPQLFLNWLAVEMGYKFTVLDYVPGTRKECHDVEEVMDHWSRLGKVLTDILAVPS